MKAEKGGRGSVNARAAGGHMEERWCDATAPTLIVKSSNWQNMDGPGAWRVSQGLLYSCFKQLFLSHHCQTCSQLRACKKTPTAGCQAVRGTNC